VHITQSGDWDVDVEGLGMMGSAAEQFATVALVLPDDKTPLLTRNLIYTGITRARRQVDIWGPGAVLQRAIEDAPARHSGLADALRGRLSERNDPCAT